MNDDLTISAPVSLASLGRLWRKWRTRCALRRSQRNAEVLREYIAFYQSELAHEHRRQVRLSNSIKDLT